MKKRLLMIVQMLIVLGLLVVVFPPPFMKSLNADTPIDLLPLRREAEVTDSRTLAHISALKENAEKGDAQSQRQLARLYEQGRWIKRDYQLAEKWYLAAAENGDAEAQAMLGSLYARKIFKVESPEKKAVMWLTRAANQGNRRAQSDLGDLYRFGRLGLEKDLVQAYKWKKLGQNGQHVTKILSKEMTPEQFSAGELLAEQWKPNLEPVKELSETQLVTIPALPKSVPLVFLSEEECQKAPTDEEYLMIRAKKGDPNAQWQLGMRHMQQDVNESIKWLRKAAKNGDPRSQSIMGKIYASTIGGVGPDGLENDMAFAQRVALSPDYKQAVDWFEKSARQGNTDSQYYLSLLLKDGLGTKQNYPEAYFWLSLVTNRYKDKYQDLLAEIKSHLTTSDVARENERVTNWKPKRVKFKQQQTNINVFGFLCGISQACPPVDQCGDIIGIDCGSATDFPYHFIDTQTKKIIGTCSFWKSFRTQQPCQPPRQWTCGRPKNYH
jgi:hypothetical protein